MTSIFPKSLGDMIRTLNILFHLFIAFFDAIFNLSLVQVNGVYNMNGRLLDWIFSSDNDFKISRVHAFVLPEDNQLPSLYFALSDRLSYNFGRLSRYKHMFSEFDDFIMKRMLSLMQWDLENKEFDDVLGIRYGALCSPTSASVPALSEFGPRFDLL